MIKIPATLYIQFVGDLDLFRWEHVRYRLCKASHNKYLDITTEQELEALATLEDENEKAAPKKWHDTTGNLYSFCGVRQMKR